MQDINDVAAVQSFAISGDKEVRRENRGGGTHGWLLYDETGELVRGLNVFEQSFIDGALAAGTATAKPAEEAAIEAVIIRTSVNFGTFASKIELDLGGIIPNWANLGARVRLVAPISEDTAKSEAFRAHLQKCSDEVATWPDWKKRPAARTPANVGVPMRRQFDRPPIELHATPEAALPLLASTSAEGAVENPP